MRLFRYFYWLLRKSIYTCISVVCLRRDVTELYFEFRESFTPFSAWISGEYRGQVSSKPKKSKFPIDSFKWRKLALKETSSSLPAEKFVFFAHHLRAWHRGPCRWPMERNIESPNESCDSGVTETDLLGENSWMNSKNSLRKTNSRKSGLKEKRWCERAF